jgi:hypothetical protein
MNGKEFRDPAGHTFHTYGKFGRDVAPAIATQIAPTNVVSHDHNDVGLSYLLRFRCEDESPVATAAIAVTVTSELNLDIGLFLVAPIPIYSAWFTKSGMAVDFGSIGQCPLWSKATFCAPSPPIRSSPR